MELHFRQAKNDDYDWCYQLAMDNMKPYVDRHWGGWDPNFFKETFSLDRTKIVLVDDKPIGFYELESDPKSAMVYGIQILPEFRNKGFGTKIMEHIETELRAKSVENLKLRVFLDNPAKRLYERLGYKPAEKNAYRMKATVLLEKKL